MMRNPYTHVTVGEIQERGVDRVALPVKDKLICIYIREMEQIVNTWKGAKELGLMTQVGANPALAAAMDEISLDLRQLTKLGKSIKPNPPPHSVHTLRHGTHRTRPGPPATTPVPFTGPWPP